MSVSCEDKSACIECVNGGCLWCIVSDTASSMNQTDFCEFNVTCEDASEGSKELFFDLQCRIYRPIPAIALLVLLFGIGICCALFCHYTELKSKEHCRENAHCDTTPDHVSLSAVPEYETPASDNSREVDRSSASLMMRGLPVACAVGPETGRMTVAASMVESTANPSLPMVTQIEEQPKTWVNGTLIVDAEVLSYDSETGYDREYW